MDIKFVVTTVISLGFLLIAFLTYLLNKKEKENKALKETVNTTHIQMNTIINNNNFSQIPPEIKDTVVSVYTSTAGNLPIIAKSVPDSNGNYSKNGNERK